MEKTQVLIVGAGPTGLVLAAELIARGVAVRVVDRGDGAVLQTRALAIHARTLEVLDLMGLADRFLASGHLVRRFRMYTGGRPLVKLELALSGSPFGFMLDIPQNETERLLRDRVAELGGAVEQGRELTGFRQHDGGGGITATIRDASGAMESVTAGYLVGCDGAHSRVRHELGLDFSGHPYSDDWLLADVHLAWDLPEDEVHAFFRHDGLPLICMPMREHVWRVILPYAGGRDPGAPTLQEVQRLVDRRAPLRVAVSDPTWLASFRCQRRSTDVYRRGRVLLAGDAVHVHSPAGGQGMNTGIMDAHNLGWKLALVAAGRAPERLLDSYGEERGPVAAEVLGLTHTLVLLGTMKHPVKRAFRDIVVPAASRIPAIHRRAVRRMTHHNVTYRSSSLTRPGRRWAGLRPGDRMPDIDVAAEQGRSRLFEVLRRGRHVLVGSGVAAAKALDCDDVRAWAEVLEAVVVEAGGHAPALLVIRPDGYIALREEADGLPAVLAYLRAAFDRQALVEPAAVTERPTRRVGSAVGLKGR